MGGGGVLTWQMINDVCPSVMVVLHLPPSLPPEGSEGVPS